MPEQKQERLLPVSWGTKTAGGYEVDLEVEANDRQRLLRDISDLMMREKVNVTAVDAVSAGAKRFAAILWVKPADVSKAAKALGARAW